jgi:ribosomal protein L9
MNKKYKNEFNIYLTQEDRDVIEMLKNQYGINISGLFKIYLRKILQQLGKTDFSIETNKK